LAGCGDAANNFDNNIVAPQVSIISAPEPRRDIKTSPQMIMANASF